MFYLHILRSLKDKKLYVGTTNNPKRRLLNYNSGKVKSTKSRRPLIIVWLKFYKTLSEARRKEWELKYTPWGGKLKKKLASINSAT